MVGADRGLDPMSQEVTWDEPVYGPYELAREPVPTWLSQAFGEFQCRYNMR